MTIPLNAETNIDYNDLAQKIRVWANELNMTAGFSRPIIGANHLQHLDNWLAAGYAGEMKYMKDKISLRKDPSLLSESCLTVISVRMNYWSEAKLTSQTVLEDNEQAYISRYALGRDYHKVLRQNLKQLAIQIEAEIGPFQYRPFSDSAPLMEHALAEQAGLGFIGKNSLLIHHEAGSTFFLGELLCNLPLPVDPPNLKCGCGPCTLCLQACPTAAITAPFVVDARRCISYLTIEYDGVIDEALRPLMGNRIYGCDDCQLSCPWNKFAQMSQVLDFNTRHQLANPKLLDIWSWSEADFLQRFEGSPVRRIGYEQWRRNLAIALGNSKASDEIKTALNEGLTTASDLVAEHIHWALRRLNQADAQPTNLLKRAYV